MECHDRDWTGVDGILDDADEDIGRKVQLECTPTAQERSNELRISRRERVVSHFKIAKISREAVGWMRVFGGVTRDHC